MPPLPTSSAAAAAIAVSLLVLLHLPMRETSIPTHEVDAMLSALHYSGAYKLIANAITTSDLRFDILESSSFTLFAPWDRFLFPLALTFPSSAYVVAFRLHSCPHRYSSSNLHHLVSSSAVTTIPTLLPPRSLRLHTAGTILALNNVELSLPRDLLLA